MGLLFWTLFFIFVVIPALWALAKFVSKGLLAILAIAALTSPLWLWFFVPWYLYQKHEYPDLTLAQSHYVSQLQDCTNKACLLKLGQKACEDSVTCMDNMPHYVCKDQSCYDTFRILAANQAKANADKADGQRQFEARQAQAAADVANRARSREEMSQADTVVRATCQNTLTPVCIVNTARQECKTDWCAKQVAKAICAEFRYMEDGRVGDALETECYNLQRAIP